HRGRSRVPGRRQRRAGGGRCRDRRPALAVPGQRAVEGLAHDLHVRRHAVRGRGGGAHPRGLRAAGDPLMGRLLLDGLVPRLGLVRVLAVPGGGVCLSSPLAAYLTGPLWLAWVLGLLAFPPLPLLWEVRASRRRAKDRTARPRFFTLWDRIVLRTLAVNVLIV